jgi:hypothetical protein
MSSKLTDTTAGSAKSRPAAARVYALIARTTRTAVVFRRGPSKSVQALRWNLADDTLEAGQWFRGRIYERRCDLSPDGALMVYFAGYRGQFRTWTAISRPPYFTALALWPKGDAWGGGGQFDSASELRLNHWSSQMGLADGFSTPKWLTIKPFGTGWGEDDPIWAERLERDGWTQVSADWPWIWEKECGPHTLQMIIRGIKETNGPWYICEHAVVDRNTGTTYEIGRSDWADWDRNGDLLFAADGCLYRDFRDPRLLIDLNDRVFRELAAPPEFQRWPRRG